MKMVRENYLIDVERCPLTHTESIDMICSIPKLAIINFNYKMLQQWSPCRIKIVSKEFLLLPSAMRLMNDGTQYRKLFLDM